MKKMIFSAAAFAVVAVSTAVVAPTTSEAIPAFARQTGAACLSCHFQSFPTLAPMGRAFKEGAFTDVGEQALIEDEMLSITSSVNMTMVLRPNFVSTTVSGDPVAANNATVKTALINDQVLMFGGRVGTNTGTFVEWNAGAANFQLLSSWDFDGIQAGVDFWFAGFGETSGMEVGSTFGQHGGLLSSKAVSASNIISGNIGDMAGVTFFAANDFVNASFGLVTAGAAFDGKVSNGWKLAPMARLFFHQEVGDFELGFGAGVTSGRTGDAGTVAALFAAPLYNVTAATTEVEMKKWMVDFQAQGEVGDMQVGIYADYAKAGAGTATRSNMFSKLGGESSGYSVRTNIKPLHTVIINAGYGIMRDTDTLAAVTKTTQFQIGAEYEIYQNFVIALIYNNTKVTSAASAIKTKTTTLDIEALL